LTDNRCRATIAGMAIGEALHAAEVPDHKSLALSLAGAVLVSSTGFALIFALFSWVPYHGMFWVAKLPPAKILLLVPIPVFLSSLLTVTMAVRGQRAIRKKRSNPS
jgi:hypothetical protein